MGSVPLRVQAKTLGNQTVSQPLEFLTPLRRVRP